MGSGEKGQFQIRGEEMRENMGEGRLGGEGIMGEEGEEGEGRWGVGRGWGEG